MSVEIAISKIKEEEFIFRNEDIKKFNEKKLEIGFNFGFDWELDEEKFIIKTTINYNYRIGSNLVELVRFSSITEFHVIGLSEILNVDGNKFQLPDFFMMTFISTAVSSGRGMLAYKLAGTYLSDYYLPLIDPKDFMNHIKNKLSASEKKSAGKKVTGKKVISKKAISEKRKIKSK